MLLSLNPAMDLSRRLDLSRYERTPSLGDSVAAAIRACNALEQQLIKFRRSHQLLRDAVLADRPSSSSFPRAHAVAEGGAFECTAPPDEAGDVKTSTPCSNARINVSSRMMHSDVRA